MAKDISVYTPKSVVSTVEDKVSNGLDKFVGWVKLEEEEYEEDTEISKFEARILKNPIYAIPSALAISAGIYLLVYLLALAS